MTPNEQLFSLIGQYLSDADLGDLFVIGTDGSPGGWLWDQITSGIDSEAAIQIALEATPQFQQRYGIIGELRAQAANGQAVHVPTVGQVREYEQTVTRLMRQAGLPEFMYDSWNDAQQLMRQGLSPLEVEDRLGQAWDRVQNTAPEVRQAFSDFYGTLVGDAALASTFLDPTRTMAALDRQSRTAYTAGMGRRLGINLDQTTADRVAALPRTEAGIVEGLGQISQLQGSGIFNETIGERNATDLAAETTGVDATFGGDGTASALLERRALERSAQRAAVPGGALRTNEGVTGVGSARR